MPFNIQNLIKDMQNYKEKYSDANYSSNKKIEIRMNKLLSQNLNFNALKANEVDSLFEKTEEFLKNLCILNYIKIEREKDFLQKNRLL